MNRLYIPDPKKCHVSFVNRKEYSNYNNMNRIYSQNPIICDYKYQIILLISHNIIILDFQTIIESLTCKEGK